MTLEEDAREFNRAASEFGVRLALAFLPVYRAVCKLGGVKSDPDAVEKTLRRRLQQLEDEQRN